MAVLNLLLTSPAGLMSLGIIVFMLLMGAYLYRHMRALMNAKPGKDGWD